jgi:hypothetical protein
MDDDIAPLRSPGQRKLFEENVQYEHGWRTTRQRQHFRAARLVTSIFELARYPGV